MKYLEIPDFHFSMKWLNHSQEVGHAVANAAHENGVDLIAAPGDWFDGPILASDKGGLTAAKKIIKEWCSIAPVVAIEGTPSHDAPGCYGIFEEIPGFYLLKPGITYGLLHHGRTIIDVNNLGLGGNSPDAILFGIPELSKKNIQARLGLPSDQANAAAERLLSDYVQQFIAPSRARFPDIPALGLIHGNISDNHRDNESDIILKSSDIVIRTEDLRPANLDRWAAGHIHKPWESKVVSCGYSGFTGMDSNPWGKMGFLPSMNFVEVNGPSDISIDRIAYGSPKRVKVKSVDFVKPGSNVAWWVDTTDRESSLPCDLHPWSRLTFKEEEKETRRVTKEEAAEVKTLWDLFKLIDPDVNPNLKAKVDQITETVKPPEVEAKEVAVTYVEIAGCVLFKGRTVKFDISSLAEALNLLTGQNGDGKSSLLSFCHPYPVIIGKDTKSGRDSAIKDFFNGKESYIKKTVVKNGDVHNHLITIKAAHTKSPKTECYLTIAGEPQLDKGTFDEMMTVCETEYGSIEDYRITTFCEQPNQATSNQSGLMSAKPIDARNIVQAIAGVNRDRERRFALDRVQECQGEAESLQFRAEAKAELLSDEDFPALINEADRQARQAGEEADRLLAEGKAVKGCVESFEEEAKRYDEKVRLISEISEDRGKLAKQEELESTLSLNELKISEDNMAIIFNKEIDEVETRNKEARLNYERAVWERNAYESGLKEVERLESRVEELKESAKLIPKLEEWKQALKEWEDAKRDIAETKSLIDVKRDLIIELDKPCEHCGKLSSTAAGKISRLTREIESLEAAIETMGKIPEPDGVPSDLDRQLAVAKDNGSCIPGAESRLAQVKDALKPAGVVQPLSLEPIIRKQPVLDFVERSAIMELIADARSAKDRISEYKEIIGKKQEVVDKIEVSPFIKEELITAKAKLEKTRADYTEAKVALSNRVNELDSLMERRNRDLSIRKEVEELRRKQKETGVEDWQYIAGMLASNKIPALELDLVLDVIDTEATESIKPFLEGRYAIETITQEEGKKGLVDRFDIIVHDREEGSELSLFSFNPGHKAFFSDAYIKALILQRNQRLHRSYSPVIFDEADSPIKEDRIGMYYEMNRAYYGRHLSRVLVVSQKDSAAVYMSNEIDVNELKEG